MPRSPREQFRRCSILNCRPGHGLVTVPDLHSCCGQGNLRMCTAKSNQKFTNQLHLNSSLMNHKFGARKRAVKLKGAMWVAKLYELRLLLGKPGHRPQIEANLRATTKSSSTIAAEDGFTCAHVSASPHLIQHTPKGLDT